MHGAIKKDLRRRSTIEAAIGHMKNEGYRARYSLKGKYGAVAPVTVVIARSCCSGSPCVSEIVRPDQGPKGAKEIER